MECNPLVRDSLPLGLQMFNNNKLGHVAALLTLKAHWFDTQTVKQWEIMINNDVLLFSETNEETNYEQNLNN